MAKLFDPSASHPRPTLRPSAAPPRLPSAAGAFVPMEELLRDMGLAAPVKPADAPLVAPHGPEAAEFQPPRPLRREATRFAHLRDDDEG